MPADPILTVSEPGDDRSLSITDQTAVREFMDLARRRFRTADTASSKRREQQMYDKRFYASEQWEPSHQAQRTADNRPCITSNRLPGIIRQVTNQSRQQHPAIQLNPVDSGSDVETAEVFQGVIRQIEIDSDAATAYTTGQENQSIIGIGYWRILTEYRDDQTFEQQVRIRRIRNPFSVYFDPSCQEADYSDANYAFIVEDVMRDEYEARYGEKVPLASLMSWASSGDDRSSDWMPTGKVRTAEYYYVEKTRDTVVDVQFPPVPPSADNPKGAPGQRLTMRKADLPADYASLGFVVYNERDVMRRLVRWAKINGVGILDGDKTRTRGREWVGKYIPIIPDMGDEIDINGEIDIKGMVRDARGPQRMLNFWASSIAEAIGTAPKAPFLIEVDQVAGLAAWWDNLNTRTFPYLPYKAKVIDGRLVPQPQRQVAETPIQAMVQGYSLTENELRSVTGLYESSLGIPSNERSGTAILARQQRGELGTSNYLDNHARAIRFTGVQLVDIIPKVYSPGTIMRIIGKDDKPKLVMLGKGESPADLAQLKLERGITGVYDLSAGKFDVTTSVGGSFQSRRQEAAVAMTELVRAYPNAFPMMGDLMIKNMDWPGAAEIAGRVKTALGIKDDDDSPLSPEAQQVVQQLQQQIEQLGQAYQQAQQEIATDATKWAAQLNIKKMELMAEDRAADADRQSKERVAAIVAQTELIIAAAKINQEHAQTLINAELERVRNLLDLKIADLDRKAAVAAAKETDNGNASDA